MNRPSADILLLVNDLARAIRTEADRRARSHGMTRAQWVILGRLERTPGLSQRELAEFLEVEPITVGRLVDRLEARGLVERRPDREDRRVWRLHLLPPALPVLEALNLQRDAILDIATRDIAPAMLDAVATQLGRMKSNMAACRKSVLPDAKDAS